MITGVGQVGRTGHYWHSKGLEIEIPLPPLQSVESITYLSGGDTIRMSPSDYVVAGIGDRWKARIRHVIGWPSADYVTEAVVVTFVAGYGDSGMTYPRHPHRDHREGSGAL